MKRTTFRQALAEHPDVPWRHHLGGEMDTQDLANHLSTYLDAEVVMDEERGILGPIREIARIVREEDEL